jgi:hypothetical protein
MKTITVRYFAMFREHDAQDNINTPEDLAGSVLEAAP